MDLPGPHTSVVEYASAAPHAGFPSRVCLITLSNSLFAIDLQSIREVFPVDSVTPVPGMPTVLTGVTNLRGIVVPLVDRSEEHTSELQSHSDLVCRLLLE